MICCVAHHKFTNDESIRFNVIHADLSLQKSHKAEGCGDRRPWGSSGPALSLPQIYRWKSQGPEQWLLKVTPSVPVKDNAKTQTS